LNYLKTCVTVVNIRILSPRRYVDFDHPREMSINKGVGG